MNENLPEKPQKWVFREVTRGPDSDPLPKMAHNERKPVGHGNCITTTPSHKRSMIQRRGHVEMSEREHHTL